MPLYPKHVAGESLLRQRLRRDVIEVAEAPDIYRGTVAAGAATDGDIGDWAAGEELGASATGSPDAFKGAGGAQSLPGLTWTPASATSPLWIKNRQSVIFYATGLSSDGSNASVTFLITGYDLDGQLISETMSLQTSNVTTQAKPTQRIYRSIHSINLISKAGSALSPTGFIAIGHGKALVDTNIAFRPRLAIPGTMTLKGAIAVLLDPNGLNVSLTTGTGANEQFDATKKSIGLPVGTGLVAGNYVLLIKDDYGERI